MPPPELNFEKWYGSINRLRRETFKTIAPTHFGIFDDPGWQLNAVEDALRAAERWIAGMMPADPSIEKLRDDFAAWMTDEGVQQGLARDVVEAYDLANPTGMSADGLVRYWKKFRAQG
jgi:hypothetical protein